MPTLDTANQGQGSDGTDHTQQQLNNLDHQASNTVTVLNMDSANVLQFQAVKIVVQDVINGTLIAG